MSGKVAIDPVCLVHGKKMSEHLCLYCCLCYKPLTPEECNVRKDGQKEDVCKPCAEREKLVMEQKENEMKDKDSNSLVAGGIKTVVRVIIGFVMLIFIMIGIGAVLNKHEDPVNDIMIAVEMATETDGQVMRLNRVIKMERLLNAIAIVESQGDPNAPGELDEVGKYQLREIYIEDVERIVGGDIRNSPEISRACIIVYLNHYATRERLGFEPTLEDMARIHNGGPNGLFNEATEPYWFKVKAVLDGWK